MLPVLMIDFVFTTHPHDTLDAQGKESNAALQYSYPHQPARVGCFSSFRCFELCQAYVTCLYRSRQPEALEKAVFKLCDGLIQLSVGDYKYQ